MSGNDPAKKPAPDPADPESEPHPPAQHNGNGSDTAFTEMLKKRQQRVSNSPEPRPPAPPSTEPPKKGATG